MFPLLFNWEKKRNIHCNDTFDNWCIIDGKVYISICNTSHILEYTPDTDSWVELPTLTKRHRIVSLNGKLTLVGGVMKNSVNYSPVIRIWDSDFGQWTERYPQMPMGRRDPGCASYQHYLIVAGGFKESSHQSTTSVEILDTKSGQWFRAPPMKFNGWNIQSVIMGQTLYLLFIIQGVMTNSKSLLRVSLPTLISHTLQGKNCDTSIWEKMPDVPLYYTTLFSIGNLLLTAGGAYGGSFSSLLSAMYIKKDKPSADIHLFNPHTNQWLKIGELPEPKSGSACTVLPSGKLLVAGGEGVVRVTFNIVPTVYTAMIAGSYFEPPHL